MKKIISTVAISCVISSALIAILALFKVLSITGIFADILLTLLTFLVASLLLLNTANLIEKKIKIAYVSTGLICLSSILVIIFFWANFNFYSSYMKITLTTCTLSVLFNVISSDILRLKGHYKVFQIISYVCFCVTSVFLIATIFKNNLIAQYPTFFILFIILSFVGFFLLSIFSNKYKDDNLSSVQFVRISKEEYDELLKTKELYEGLKKND